MEVVVADDREVEAGLLGEGDVAHQLLRARLLAHHRVADQGHGVPPCCSSALRRSGAATEPLISGLLPFVSQAGKDGEPVIADRLEGEREQPDCPAVLTGSSPSSASPPCSSESAPTTRPPSASTPRGGSLMTPEEVDEPTHFRPPEMAVC